jgi:sporulation protein YlmC with PRC-barrel domain
MNKVFILLAGVSLLSLGFVVDVHAMGSMAKSGVTTYETFDLRGTQVKSPEGEALGSISDFVMDPKGQIIFVVLYYDGSLAYDDGKYVAVPFRALSISEVKPHEINVVLNMNKWKLGSAPSFDMGEGVTDIEGAVDIYRYFGQQPYWTEGESAKGNPASTWWSEGP